MRITKPILLEKVAIVNRLLGFNEGHPLQTITRDDGSTFEYGAARSIVLSGAYGGHAVHRVADTGTGTASLTAHVPAREAATYLDGMIEALRISNGQ